MSLTLQLFLETHWISLGPTHMSTCGSWGLTTLKTYLHHCCRCIWSGRFCFCYLDPQGRWFDPWCGHDKICTAVVPLSKALNPTLLQGVCLLLSLINCKSLWIKASAKWHVMWAIFSCCILTLMCHRMALLPLPITKPQSSSKFHLLKFLCGWGLDVSLLFNERLLVTS